MVLNIENKEHFRHRGFIHDDLGGRRVFGATSGIVASSTIYNNDESADFHENQTVKSWEERMFAAAVINSSCRLNSARHDIDMQYHQQKLYAQKRQVHLSTNNSQNNNNLKSTMVVKKTTGFVSRKITSVQATRANVRPSLDGHKPNGWAGPKIKKTQNTSGQYYNLCNVDDQIKYTEAPDNASPHFSRHHMADAVQGKPTQRKIGSEAVNNSTRNSAELLHYNNMNSLTGQVSTYDRRSQTKYSRAPTREEYEKAVRRLYKTSSDTEIEQEVFVINDSTSPPLGGNGKHGTFPARNAAGRNNATNTLGNRNKISRSDIEKLMAMNYRVKIKRSKKRRNRIRSNPTPFLTTHLRVVNHGHSDPVNKTYPRSHSAIEYLMSGRKLDNTNINPLVRSITSSSSASDANLCEPGGNNVSDKPKNSSLNRRCRSSRDDWTKRHSTYPKFRDQNQIATPNPVGTKLHGNRESQGYDWRTKILRKETKRNLIEPQLKYAVSEATNCSKTTHGLSNPKFIEMGLTTMENDDDNVNEDGETQDIERSTEMNKNELLSLIYGHSSMPCTFLSSSNTTSSPIMMVKSINDFRFDQILNSPATLSYNPYQKLFRRTPLSSDLFSPTSTPHEYTTCDLPEYTCGYDINESHRLLPIENTCDGEQSNCDQRGNTIVQNSLSHRRHTFEPQKARFYSGVVPKVSRIRYTIAELPQTRELVQTFGSNYRMTAKPFELSETKHHIRVPETANSIDVPELVDGPSLMDDHNRDMLDFPNAKSAGTKEMASSSLVPKTESTCFSRVYESFPENLQDLNSNIDGLNRLTNVQYAINKRDVPFNNTNNNDYNTVNKNVYDCNKNNMEVDNIDEIFNELDDVIKKSLDNISSENLLHITSSKHNNMNYTEKIKESLDNYPNKIYLSEAKYDANLNKSSDNVSNNKCPNCPNECTDRRLTSKLSIQCKGLDDKAPSYQENNFENISSAVAIQNEKSPNLQLTNNPTNKTTFKITLKSKDAKNIVSKIIIGNNSTPEPVISSKVIKKARPKNQSKFTEYRKSFDRILGAPFFKGRDTSPTYKDRCHSVDSSIDQTTTNTASRATSINSDCNFESSGDDTLISAQENITFDTKSTNIKPNRHYYEAISRYSSNLVHNLNISDTLNEALCKTSFTKSSAEAATDCLETFNNRCEEVNMNPPSLATHNTGLFSSSIKYINGNSIAKVPEMFKESIFTAKDPVLSSDHEICHNFPPTITQPPLTAVIERVPEYGSSEPMQSVNKKTNAFFVPPNEIISLKSHAETILGNASQPSATQTPNFTSLQVVRKKRATLTIKPLMARHEQACQPNNDNCTLDGPLVQTLKQPMPQFLNKVKQTETNELQKTGELRSIINDLCKRINEANASFGQLNISNGGTLTRRHANFRAIA